MGREHELAAVAERLELASAGQSQVVWIDGAAGLGKTSLVNHVIGGLGDRFTVAWAEGDELSMDASYSFLTQLAPVAATGPFAAGLELIDHLAAAHGPVVVVAEDLQWADAASRGALLTAARRLRHDPVAILVTSRPGTRLDGWDRFVLDPERCLRLELGGLTEDEVAALAASHGVELSAAPAERLQRHTEGHPLHVRTLLTELTPTQLQSGADGLPAPRSLAAITVATLAALPRDARELAAALAVMGTTTDLAVAAAVAGIDAPTDALDALLASGLVEWSPSVDGTPVAFTHPLLRTAVYEDLPPARRRELHLAAAGVTRWGTAWAHRIAASDSPDDELADELDAGAQYELDRFELGTAALYLSWSSSVTSDRDRSEERVLRAARFLIIDGQADRAAALLPKIELCAETALRDLVLGMLAFAQADALEAERWLRGVEHLPAPTWVHAAAHAELSSLYSLRGRASQIIASSTAALALRPFDDSNTDHRVWWAHAVGIGMQDGPRAGLDALAERLDGPPGDVRPEDAELLVIRGILHDHVGDPVAAAADLRTAIDLARAGLPFLQLPRAHLALAAVLVRTGDWDESQLHARTAQSLIDEHRVWMPGQAEATMVPVLAARGDLELASAHSEVATSAAAELGTMELDGLARVARAALAEASGDPSGVVAAFGPIADEARPHGLTLLAFRHWWAALVRALIERGDLDEARLQLERWEPIGTGAGLDLTTYACDLRARLAVAEDDPEAAAGWFERAVAALSDHHPVLDRARLHHAYGRLLRARGARRLASDQLRTAHEILDRLGAETYLRAVDEDLVGWTGQGAGREERSPLALTAREQDVVALVTTGLTNKEVGAKLYISAKAVEYHLGNVYGKLGIRSRRELRDLVPAT